MKTILTLLLVLCLHTGCLAQRPQWTIVSSEDAIKREYSTRHYIYYKDINQSLDKFVGTWVYNQNNESFKITFTKKTNQIRKIHSLQKEDLLLTQYEYKRNGATIFETYTSNISLIDYCLLKDSNTVIMIYGRFSYTHTSKKEKVELLRISYSLNSKHQPILTWLKSNEVTSGLPTRPYWFSCNYTISDISDFIAPANMILTKE